MRACSRRRVLSRDFFPTGTTWHVYQLTSGSTSLLNLRRSIPGKGLSKVSLLQLSGSPLRLQGRRILDVKMTQSLIHNRKSTHCKPQQSQNCRNRSHWEIGQERIPVPVFQNSVWIALTSTRPVERWNYQGCTQAILRRTDKRMALVLCQS